MDKGITKAEFDILSILADSDDTNTQTVIAGKTGHSLNMIKSVYTDLHERGYIADGRLTEKGFEAIEPYRAERAVFIAAGFGSRMVPVTLSTPKPLVKVHGKRLIDGLLDACLNAGIEEIYIVRGYLGDRFDELLTEYPMIRFIDNPLYDKANNVSSALMAKDLLSRSYVLEADLLLSNPYIITKYHYRSDFLAIKKEKTDDWCFEVEDGIITKEKVGGTDTWQMVGISYWNAEDGLKLSEDIKKAYDLPGGKDLYWEQVPLKVFKNRYKVAVRECRDEDIVEIDTFDELKQIDTTYCDYTE